MSGILGKLNASRLAWVCVAIGVVLRLMWLGDMEYKADQVYTYQSTQGLSGLTPWPALGMPSSAGPRNPGGSVWVFSMLATISQASTPLELGRAVVLWNCLGLALLLVVILSAELSAVDRRAALWGLALLCVSPFAVKFQRIIWAQSVLLPFLAAWLLCFFNRDRLWFAFGLGLVASLIGQIHLAGFHFLAATALGCALLGRRSSKQVHWRGLGLGVFLGMLTAIPWVTYMVTTQPRTSGFRLADALSFQFWLYLLSEPAGFSMKPYLGTLLSELRRGPFILFEALALGATALLWARFFWKQGLRPKARLSDLELALLIGCVFTGVLLAMQGVRVYRHYILIVYPLPFIAIAYAGLRAFSERQARWLLCTLWVSSLAMTLATGLGLHKNGGAADADYGVAYSRQQGDLR